MTTITNELNAIKAAAIADAVAKCKDRGTTFAYGRASAEINGKAVECEMVPQGRASVRIQKPKAVWKLNGKRVAAASLQSAISA